MMAGAAVQISRAGSGKPESPFASRSLSNEMDVAIQKLVVKSDGGGIGGVDPDVPSKNNSSEVSSIGSEQKPSLQWLSIRTSSAFDQQREESVTPKNNNESANNNAPLMSVLSNENEGLVLQEILPGTSRDTLGFTIDAGVAQGVGMHAYDVKGGKGAQSKQNGVEPPHHYTPLPPIKSHHDAATEEELEIMKEEVLASLNKKHLNRENSDGTALPLDDSGRRPTGDVNAFSLMSSEFVRQISAISERSIDDNIDNGNKKDVTKAGELATQPLADSTSTIIRNIKKDDSNRMSPFDTRPLWRMQSTREGGNSQVPVVSSSTPYRKGTSFDIDWENDIVFDEKGFLGEGSFGKVFRGNWENHQVVAKVFKPEFQDEVDKRTQKIFETELEIMCRVQHDNIVQCFGGCKRPRKRALVMEYMDKGSLDTYIHKKRQSMKLIHYFKIVKSVAKALNYLHPTIVHLDIKPQNILLNSKGMVKVADFGLSRFKETSALSSSCNMGTAQYIAPEMLTGTHRPTFKLDIYALGVLMWEMYTGNRPWEGFLECQIAYQVMQGERPSIPIDCPEEIRDMMIQCWDADPRVRPSANEIYTWCKRMIQIEDKRETPIVLHRSQRKKQQR